MALKPAASDDAQTPLPQSAAGRALEQASRGLLRLRTVIARLARNGLRYSYHQYQERQALQGENRAAIRPHLRARLDLAAARRGSTIGAMLESAGCHKVDELTFDLLQKHQADMEERARSLSLNDALDLYQYFRFFGDFRTSNWLRRQTSYAYLRQQESMPMVFPDALAAALEEGQIDLVLNTVRDKHTQPTDLADVREIRALAHALRGELTEATELWLATFTPEDLRFQEAIQGRTIAVVGPAPPIEEIRSELDSFDLIVRTNFQLGLDPSYGARTEISYYNGNRLVSHRNEILTIASSLQWLISVRGSDAALKEMLPTHQGIRAAENARSLFVNANPLAIPTILYDLVRFRPATIKLFCTNFFKSRVTYSKGYHRNFSGAEGIAHSLRVHDPYSSFKLIQQLRLAGLCKADSMATEILDLSCDEYASALQELYGTHIIANEHPHLKTDPVSHPKR